MEINSRSSTAIVCVVSASCRECCFVSVSMDSHDYDIALRVAADCDVGLMLQVIQGELFVAAVCPYGAAAAFNKFVAPGAGRIVLVGDRIREVNGYRSSERMLREIEECRNLHISFTHVWYVACLAEIVQCERSRGCFCYTVRLRVAEGGNLGLHVCPSQRTGSIIVLGVYATGAIPS